MADYGLKVAKPGESAESNDVTKHTFNSEKNCMKVDIEGNSGTNTYSISAGTSETKTYGHGFNFIPGFLVWFEVDNSGNWYPMYSTTNNSVHCYAYSDNTNLNVVIDNNDSSSHNVSVFYVVIADNAG